jgi:monoamine oxidase
MTTPSTGNPFDVIIIGAGASGLIAMKELLKSGHSVCLLEAMDRAGGRIATVHDDDGFSGVVEKGGEFIHGKLPLTLKLLKKAGIKYLPVTGEMTTIRNGQRLKSDAHDEHWKEFMRCLSKLKTDVTIDQFLDKYFPSPEYENLRNAVKTYSEGFDLADTSKASMIAAKDEWPHEGERSFRLPGGYCQLIDWLEDECQTRRGSLYFNQAVNKIEYEKGRVSVQTITGDTFTASRLIVTVPAGVLQSGDIEFNPALTTHAEAIHHLGFGDVIKILLEFRKPFWEERWKDAGFFLSDEEIPTWWTQLPIQSNLLTGWVGGPLATAKSNETVPSLLSASLLSLSSIFGFTVKELEEQLVHHKIIFWRHHPYVKGGYSYNTVYSAVAKSVLAEPVLDTVYFAGEALYDGVSQGTVESALQSGLIVSKKVKGSLKKK